MNHTNGSGLNSLVILNQTVEDSDCPFPPLALLPPSPPRAWRGPPPPTVEVTASGPRRRDRPRFLASAQSGDPCIKCAELAGLELNGFEYGDIDTDFERL